MSFKHLSRYEVPKGTVPFVFYQIDGEPSLDCMAATEANRPYHNALLKRNAKLAQRFRAGRISREMLERNRDEDRELYARYVVKGWSAVKDDKGKAVPFSAEACLQFFQALPNYLFDDLRQFCTAPMNFVDDDTPDEAAVAEQAGN